MDSLYTSRIISFQRGRSRPISRFVAGGARLGYLTGLYAEIGADEGLLELRFQFRLAVLGQQRARPGGGRGEVFDAVGEKHHLHRYGADEDTQEPFLPPLQSFVGDLSVPCLGVVVDLRFEGAPLRRGRR